MNLKLYQSELEVNSDGQYCEVSNLYGTDQYTVLSINDIDAISI